MRATAQFLAYNPSQVKPGWIAFIVVMALCLATFLLWRNMNKQMRKIDVPYRSELTGGSVRPAPGADPHADGHQSEDAPPPPER